MSLTAIGVCMRTMVARLMIDSVVCAIAPTAAGGQSVSVVDADNSLRISHECLPRRPDSSSACRHHTACLGDGPANVTLRRLGRGTSISRRLRQRRSAVVAGQRPQPADAYGNRSARAADRAGYVFAGAARSDDLRLRMPGSVSVACRAPPYHPDNRDHPAHVAILSEPRENCSRTPPAVSRAARPRSRFCRGVVRDFDVVERRRERQHRCGIRGSPGPFARRMSGLERERCCAKCPRTGRSTRCR